MDSGSKLDIQINRLLSKGFPHGGIGRRAVASVDGGIIP